VVAAGAVSPLKTPIRKASDYVVELGLDEDEESSVQDDIDEVRGVWAAIVGNQSQYPVSDSERSKESSIYDKLMTKLGTTYSDEDHGSELHALVKKEQMLLENV
jgi:hypothetical protein